MSVFRRRAVQGHALRLEGLLEGTHAGGGDEIVRWRAWRAPTWFPADIDISARGNRFSFLFVPKDDARGDEHSESAIAEALAELLRQAPPGSLGQLSSSVRSLRGSPTAVVLTVYSVDANGAVRIEQRETEPLTETVRPPLRQRLRLSQWPVALGLVALTIALAWQLAPVRSAVQTPLGLLPPTPVLASSAFDAYFQAEVRPGLPLGLVLKRRLGYPRDPAALDAAASAADGLHGVLALSAIARGYIRCEWYDDSGRFLYGADLRVRELEAHETITIALPAIPDAASFRLLY